MKLKLKDVKSSILKHRILWTLAALIVAAFLPVMFSSSYAQGILTKIVIYAIIASGLNIINGYSGQTCLGMAGFMCVGSYMAAILNSRFEVPTFLCVLAGTVFAAFVGFIVSLPTLRLAGTFLTIITLGFSETIRLIAINWISVTNGTLGIKGLPSLSLFGLRIKSGAPYYWFVLAILAATLFLLSRILSSRIGRAWISIREDQDAARSLGVEIAKYKSINFIIGAMIGGLGGTLMLFYYRYTAPDMFILDEGFNVLSMVTIGGTRHTGRASARLHPHHADHRAAPLCLRMAHGAVCRAHHCHDVAAPAGPCRRVGQQHRERGGHQNDAEKTEGGKVNGTDSRNAERS